ncbi:MAG: ABC transporter ATP-binding protein [Pseudomonadota bacterium]
MSDTPSPDAPIVHMRDLRFTWPGRDSFGLVVPAFDVKAGERVMLAGPSGSGKSTLLSLICAVLKPQSGTLSVCGADLAAMRSSARDRFRAAHIGVVFQQFNLLPYASIKDNILLPLSFAPNRRQRIADAGDTPDGAARKLLDALDLSDIPLQRKAANLSIGQQQRVAVARALIGEPELVIADEPTSALDAGSQDRFLDLMFAQLEATGASVLMVSHDTRLGTRFDRTVALADILKSGSETSSDAPRAAETSHPAAVPAA